MQTPAGNVHFQAPVTHATPTPVVHSGRVADGLTPQTCVGEGATTFSSIWPLQLSSRPLQVSCAEMKSQAYSQVPIVVEVVITRLAALELAQRLPQAQMEWTAPV